MKNTNQYYPSITRALRNAHERKELFLRYQPQVSLVSGDVIAAEALIGWNHPELGMLTSGSFLLLAEETGLIVPIGEWVVGEVCRQIKSWQGQKVRPLYVSINISLQQFERGNVLQTITGALESSGVDSSLIGVEIKESTLTEGAELVFDALRGLNAAGINIALDHFGTGCSSFANFKDNCLIEELKIDKFFMADIARNPDDAAIVSSIISMAQRLGMVVVAEGMETQEQVNALKRLGCDIGQGYFFSKPLLPEEMVAFMSGYPTASAHKPTPVKAGR